MSVANECLQRAAYEALQVAAGAGFMREAPYEQIARDCGILTIFEGTDEVLRLYIALSGLKELGKSPGEPGSQAIATARIFAQQAKRRMAGNVRRITRNEDADMDELAGFIVNKESYPWDVLS